MTTLKPYVGSDDYPEDAAILIFAHNTKEAKTIGWPTIKEFCNCEYTQMRIKRLPAEDYIMKQADQNKLQNGVPHIIDSPQTCKNCEWWGRELNEDGYCEGCQDERDDKL